MLKMKKPDLGDALLLGKAGGKGEEGFTGERPHGQSLRGKKGQVCLKLGHGMGAE